MKTLVPRAIKSIDQDAQSGPYLDGTYIPIEDLQRWTGLGVSPETAMNYVTVFQCINVLASTFAQLPLILYRRGDDESRERAKDDPLYRLFHTQPNPQMSSYTWRYLLMSHLKTWGNAYNEKTYDGLGRLQLWPIRPDRIDVSYEAGERVYDYLHPTEGRKRMAPGSVFHVQNGSSTSGLHGLSPIAALRATISLAKTAETYGQAVFANGARPGVVLSHPKNLSTDAIKRLAAQTDDLRGSKNAGKTIVLEEGLTVTEVGFPPEDAQWMGLRLFQTQQLAGGFGVPPGMAGDAKARKEDDKERLIEDTMAAEFVNFEQAAQIDVINDEALYLEFLTDGFLRTDPKARADANAVMWEHGALNSDEWRRRENMNPLDDEQGKTYWRPANWVPMDADPVPVGGDASTGFAAPDDAPADAALVPNLTRIKMAQFDCPDCGKIINRLAAPGTVGHCKSCKAEKTFGTAAPAEDVAVTGLRAAIKSLAEPPVVNVPAPIVNVPAPVVNVDTQAIADAMGDLRQGIADDLRGVVVEMNRPRERHLTRDDSGRIVSITA